MLNGLKRCFEDRMCPNYWIPTMSVFGDLDGSDCARKLKVLEKIIMTPQKYIADQWLEYTRCIRLNCCYCGDSEVVKQIFESSEVGDKFIDSDLFCCSCKHRYGIGLCGQCRDVSKEFEIY